MPLDDLTQLRDEIEADPEALGYKEASGAWKADDVIAGLLNDPANGATIWRTGIPMSDVYGAVDWAEFVGLAATPREAFRLITSTEVLDADSANIQNALGQIFTSTDAPNSRAALMSLAQKQGSRAEVLWGDGTTISASEVGRAANLL